VRQIVIPDDFPTVFSQTQAEEKLRSLGAVRVYTQRAADPSELIDRIKEAEAVINIRAYTHFTRAVLSACPRLKILAIWGTGTDHVDLDAAAQLGITVTNTPGANAATAAEHTLTVLLALARRLPYLDREVRAGNWPRVEIFELNEKVMGIFGLGAIGSRVARAAHALGMKVTAWTIGPSPMAPDEDWVEFGSKERLLEESDVVSLHLRLSELTEHFIKRQDFNRMKPSALFVNTARAGLVEPGALEEALQRGQIAGAALDVFDEEPVPPDAAITGLPNVILTPHIAGTSPQAVASGLMMTVEHVEAFLAGQEIDPKYVVVGGR
jgi:phosphoglycerate dehydrogenase-like enzyme